MPTTGLRGETATWRLALAAAVLLLFAPLSGRTTWTDHRGAEIRDAAGWDWIARLAGAGAIVALAAGRAARPRVPAAALSAAIAVLSFGIAAVAAGRYWAAIAGGVLQPQSFTLDLSEYAVRPAPGPPYFAVIAAVGAGCAALLLLRWLRPAAPAR